MWQGPAEEQQLCACYWPLVETRGQEYRLGSEQRRGQATAKDLKRPERTEKTEDTTYMETQTKRGQGLALQATLHREVLGILY